MNVFPTAFTQFLRHPGAGCFVWSSAVGYNCAILWYLTEMFGDLVCGYANSIRQFLIRFSPRRGISRVDKRKLLATLHSLPDFVRRDPCCFHCYLQLEVYPQITQM